MQIFCQGKKLFLSPSVRLCYTIQEREGLSLKEDFQHSVLIPLVSFIQFEGGF